MVALNLSPSSAQLYTFESQKPEQEKTENLGKTEPKNLSHDRTRLKNTSGTKETTKEAPAYQYVQLEMVQVHDTPHGSVEYPSKAQIAYTESMKRSRDDASQIEMLEHELPTYALMA